MQFNAGRRALILAGLAMTVAGCAAKAPQTQASGTPPATSGRPTETPSPSPEPTPSSPHPEPQLVTPTRDEIIERFNAKVPQHWGLDVPGVISTLPAGATGVALTLDYCGGPGGNQADHTILNLLRQHDMPATLFLNSRWITDNPALAKELAENPLFEIANHGTRHLPLSVTGQSAYGIPGTTGPGAIYDEIMDNTTMITNLTGKAPRFFRPGTAHLDEISTQICLALGQTPTGFSINADAGATYPARIVTQEVGRAQAGDIIIAHGNQPNAATGKGLAEALNQRHGRGGNLVTLTTATTT